MATTTTISSHVESTWKHVVVIVVSACYTTTVEPHVVYTLHKILVELDTRKYCVNNMLFFNMFATYLQHT